MTISTVTSCSPGPAMLASSSVIVPDLPSAAKVNVTSELTIARNQSPCMIMDGDRPVAQIVPVPTRRKIVTIPELAGSISKEDLFSDDSELWEAVNA